MERIRNDDHTENGWKTTSNSIKKPAYTNFTELKMLETIGISLLRGHQAPDATVGSADRISQEWGFEYSNFLHF